MCKFLVIFIFAATSGERTALLQVLADDLVPAVSDPALVGGDEPVERVTHHGEEEHPLPRL